MDFTTYIKFDGEIRNFYQSFNINTLFSFRGRGKKIIANSDTFLVRSYKIVTINNISYLLLKNNGRERANDSTNMPFMLIITFIINHLMFIKQLELKFVNVDHWSKGAISKMKQTYKKILENIQFNLDNLTIYPKIVEIIKPYFLVENNKLIFNFIYSPLFSTFSSYQNELIIVNHNSKAQI